MLQNKKQMAVFYNFHFDKCGEAEIQSLQDALKKAADKFFFRFKTYDIPFTEVDGKLLEGEPENFSGWHYPATAKVYGLSEIIAEMEKEIRSYEDPKSLSQSFYGISKDVLISVLEQFKQKDPDGCFIPEPGRPGDWIELKAADKAYDQNGRQIWPRQNKKPQPGLKS